MRDIDHGDAETFVQQFQLDLHALAQLLVERAQGFVEQDEFRLEHQGARQRHPLLLAARQLPRPAVTASAEVDDVEHVVDLPADLVPGHVPAPQAERHVLKDVHVREECVGLEHHVHVALVGRHPGDVPASEPHRPRGGILEAGDHAHGGRLAATGRPEQGEELTLGDLEVHRADRRHDVASGAELLRHAGQLDGRQRSVLG